MIGKQLSGQGNKLTSHGSRSASIDELKELLEQQLKAVWRAVESGDGTSMLAAGRLSTKEMEAARTAILLHDLHKVFPASGFKHDPLPSPLKEADMYASRMSRETVFTRKNFTGNSNRIRYSHATRMQVTDREPAAQQLLGEIDASNAVELHQSILEARKLAVLNEAKATPFTSLKHHLLLACSLVENFIEAGKLALQGLILCAGTVKPENRFKIIGTCYRGSRKQKKHWLWIDSKYCNGGNSHLFMSFKDTWNNMVGLNPREITLGSAISAVNSWTAGLATLESGSEG